MNAKGWIAVDLDGTLARYSGWVDEHHIGEPIPLMVERVRAWLSEGREVRIFTARVAVAEGNRAQSTVDAITETIQRWCRENLGQALDVTCSKDYGMVELWDDRCVQVIPNTGQRADARASSPDPAVTDALALLASRTDGENRALVEVISCRLGFGHASDLITRPDPAREALVGALNQLLSSPIFTEVIRMVACWDGKEEKKAPPHPFDWPCVIPTVCGEAYALKTYVENLVRTLAEQGHKG